MAKPSTQKQTGQVDLFAIREAKRKELEQIEREIAEEVRRNAESIRKWVLETLGEVSNRIQPLIDQEAWSWRNQPEFDGVLAELELSPKEPKPIELNKEMAEMIVEFVRGKKGYGATIDDIANGILDADGKPKWKVGSLRPQLPLIVRAGQLKQKPNPANQRQNLYFVE